MFPVELVRLLWKKRSHETCSTWNTVDAFRELLSGKKGGACSAGNIEAKS